MSASSARLTGEHLRALRARLGTYCRHALKIQTKAGVLTELDPNFPQRLLAERVESQRRRTGRVRVVVLKARQEGISTWCAARIFHGTTLWSHRRGLVLADKLERAGEIFSIYERFDRHLPAPLRPPKRTSRRARELAWTTDSRLTVETAGDADAGRGTTIHFLHASELAMWPRAEETWTALMQAVPSDRGEVYVESTAKGIGNLFHRMWVAAESGTSEWCAVFLPWWIHAEYAQDRRRASVPSGVPRDRAGGVPHDRRRFLRRRGARAVGGPGHRTGRARHVHRAQRWVRTAAGGAGIRADLGEAPTGRPLRDRRRHGRGEDGRCDGHEPRRP